MDKRIKHYESIIEPYVNKMASTCSYCDHLDDLILLEGKHCYTTLAIGQIVEGYVQMCAQKHRTAMTGLYKIEIEEAEKMKKAIKETYANVYGVRGIAFEHGQAGICHWHEDAEKNLRTLCYHSHMHFVPVEIDINELIQEYLPEFYEVNSILEMRKIREEELDGKPYLFFENAEGKGFLYPVEDKSIVPRQFLRTCVAKKLGIEEKGDWIKYPGVELFEISKIKLQKTLYENWNRLNNG